MKQNQTLLFIFILALSVGLASCKKDNPTASPQTQATTEAMGMATKCGRVVTPPTPPRQTCGTATSVSLQTSQHVTVGSVNVSNDATNLYVTYTATGNWRLEELHLYAGAASAVPATNSGVPVPGQFSKSADLNRAQSYTFTIPLSGLPACFIVAAEAEVSAYGCNTQVAWGAGTRFTTSGGGGSSYYGHNSYCRNNYNYYSHNCDNSSNCSWATYFNYCEQPCTTTCIVTPQLLFNGENQWPNNATNVTVAGFNYTYSGTSTIYYNDPANDAKNALLLVATFKLYGNTISPPSNVTSAATIVENWLATLGQLTDTSQFTAPSNVQTAISTLATWESSQYCQ